MIITKDEYFQWDVNQYIQIKEKYADFIINGQPYRLEAENGKVKIPDEVFQTSGKKKAYVCYENGTVEEFTIKVTARPMPTGYVYEETERITFDSLTEDVREALENVQQYDDEIASIKQKLSDKVEFYPVYLEQAPDRFIHYEEDGTATELHFADLADKYNDEKYFLYLEYASITFIPSLPPVEDPIHDAIVLEFSAVWHYGGEQRITSVKINSDEELKIDEFVCASKDEIPSLEGYVKETDYASTANAGVVKTSSANGLFTNSSSGMVSIVSASEAEIDAKTNNYKPITPKNLEYAVKSVTDKPWVLKGTLTVDNVISSVGVNVDLAGSTELVIVGTYVATGSANLSTNVQTLYDSFFTNASRTLFTHFKDTEWGIEPISDKFRGAKNSSYAYGNGTSAAWLNGKHISDITNIRSSTSASIFTECDIKIYAR